MASATSSASSMAQAGSIPKKKGPAKPVIPCYVKACQWISDNRFFVFLTTFLTCYALMGDDCRVMWTNKPLDPVFDIFTLTCLGTFTFEIITSCIGKDDYFMGFFFILDVVSTSTLILDLSAVAEAMQGGGDAGEDDSTGSLRTSRTARLGAKAGRIVRVIRLVRILKLYKAIHEAKARKKRMEEKAAAGEKKDAGEDDWDDDELAEEEAKDAAKASAGGDAKESRFGKKLSDITTRRVIVLILTML